MQKLFFLMVKRFLARLFMDRAKKKGILLYLKALRGLRLSLIGLCGAFLFLQMMIVGLIGTIAIGIWLLPIDDINNKIWALFSFFALSFLIPLVILMIGFSERLWVRFSGVEKMVKTQRENSFWD